MKENQLIFIISLPRSGSTLLQKILTINKNVNSVSEPWLLLPLTHIVNPKGTKAIYSHKKSSEFITDLINELPNKALTFNTYIKEFVLNVYGELISTDSSFFLDKTPRYYRILDDLFEIFPNSKFIFLTRDPIQITASIIDSKNMCNGDISKLNEYQEDLFDGFNFLANGIKKYGKKACVIDYTKFLLNSEKELIRICNYIGISYHKDMLTRWKKVNFSGSAGDVTGVNNYTAINTDSITSWEKTINTRTKKKIVKKVLKSISTENFAYLNSSEEQLMNTIDSHSNGFNILLSIKDFIRYRLSNLKYVIKNFVLKY